MQVMTTDQFADAVLPHWSVTFSVGDTDAVAQQAVKLGGKVTVPPFEVSYTRVAVISDPQRGCLHREPIQAARLVGHLTPGSPKSCIIR